MLDFVFVAMFGIIAAMVFSILQVRKKHQQLHRNIQVASALILVLAIVVFEIDMRLVTDWRELAKPSRFYESGLVDITLYIHLCFAIPCPFVWAFVIWNALRRFPVPVGPGEHSQSHRFWGKIAAVTMLMTAITGWVFYTFAFVL